MNSTTLRAGALAAGLLVPVFAMATDGYFAHGYGMKSLGMGGAGVAVAQEPFGGAVNPAAMGFLDSQWQVGIEYFSPDRSASRTGSGPANVDGSVTSDKSSFFIPEFGINWALSPTLAAGVTVYGNGGMNTDYPGGQIPAQSACAQFNPAPGPYNLLCGNNALGVDLQQLMVAPYLSWKFHPDHALGIAPILAFQIFKAYGVQAFDNPMLSTSPGNVTNRGHDNAFGFGARVGYMGNFGPVSVGAAYQTKVAMDEFGDYAGLFAQAGSFDIPASVLVGASWRPIPQLLLALDWERIYYSDVAAVANPSALIGACAMMGVRDACLGGSNGAGFGWQDVDVWKVGVQYALDDRWTLRAGYNHSDNPIQPADVTFNILAPGVMTNHYTLGASYALDKHAEVTGFAMYAPSVSVTGTSLLVGFGAPPTTTETIQMKEWAIGFAYAQRF